MQTIALILGAYSLLHLGFIFGKVYALRKKRVQCLNCGSHHTTHISSVHGSGGGLCKFAVITNESHLCYDCGDFTQIGMKILK